MGSGGEPVGSEGPVPGNGSGRVSDGLSGRRAAEFMTETGMRILGRD